MYECTRAARRIALRDEQGVFESNANRLRVSMRFTENLANNFRVLAALLDKLEYIVAFV